MFPVKSAKVLDDPAAASIIEHNDYIFLRKADHMNEVTAKTSLACLLGSPVRHSFSPVMHNYAFQKLGIDCIYLAFDISKEQLKTTLDGLKAMQFVGCNLTMPLKTAVIPYLDELSQVSRLTQSVNTVVYQNGKLYGTSTDGKGYLTALAAKGYAVQNQKLVLLGSGGAATAIAVQAALDGAAEIAIFARHPYPRAEETAGIINEQTNCRATVHLLSDQDALRRELSDSLLLCNCTSVGMKPMEDACPISDASVLHPDLLVTDIIYNPPKTKLLQIAEAAGCQTMNGLGMLLYQGALSFEAWTGQTMPVEEVKALLPFQE